MEKQQKKAKYAIDAAHIGQLCCPNDLKTENKNCQIECSFSLIFTDMSEII